MRILITGGGGLIGQAIAKKHIAEGDEVFIYDTRVNKYNDYSNLVGEDVTFEEWEGNPIPKTIYAVLKYNDAFDIISNQAARVGVGQSQYEVGQYVEDNVGGTAKLIQAIIDTGKYPIQIIHAGSMGPYGDAGSTDVAVTEEHPQSPLSVYAVTKQAQENLLRAFALAHKVQVISLRYFSVYSNTQNPLNPYTGVLSVMANQLLNNDCLEMYDAGEQTRDLVNVEDVANAHFLATRPSKVSNIFEAINIGSGRSYELHKIAYKMGDMLAPHKVIFFNGMHRLGDIIHMKADITKAKEVLGWWPEHYFSDDVEEYCRFIKRNKEKFTVGNTVKEEQLNIERRGLVK